MYGYDKNALGEKEWERLDRLANEKVLLPKDSSDFYKHLENSDCLLVRLGATVDNEMMDKAPKLKYIGMFGTGYGRIDTEYAAKKGITVCNIAGYCTEGVAELAIALILEHIRELERAKAQARNGDYSEATFQSYELKDKKFGVIGLGRIGGRIAEIAKSGFGADVSYWSRKRKKEMEKRGFKFQEINTLLKESDFISLNLAYVPETKLFMDETKISRIKPGAVFVALVQMELVDIDALEKRLKLNDMTFILDHSDELPSEQAKQLSQYKNCVMYPPVGYITKEATAAKLSMLVDTIENFLNGKPTNKVN